MNKFHEFSTTSTSLFLPRSADSCRIEVVLNRRVDASQVPDFWAFEVVT